MSDVKPKKKRASLFSITVHLLTCKTILFKADR